MSKMVIKEPIRNQYVGHRYVPKIFGEWDQQGTYEGLSIVTHQGASYTSKKRVPVGIPITNEEYWVVTGNYNAQVETYRQDVQRHKTETAAELLKKATNEKVDNIVLQVDSFQRLAVETDDTGLLQRAINYAGERGATLLFSAKEYKFSSTLNITFDSLKLIGKMGKTVLLYKGTGRALSFDKGGQIGTTNYGDSLTGFVMKGINITADMVYTSDSFGRPTNWMDATALYLNGARNFSLIENCSFTRFNRGVHAVFNWMGNIKTNLFQSCKEGLFLEDECNNLTWSDNIFRRMGDVSNQSGYAAKIKGSYSVIGINNDLESSNCAGFIYENTHSFLHLGGDIENNDRSVRKIRVLGREGDDLTDRRKWSYGGEIAGVRFRNTLGIEFLDGSRSVRVSACTFSDSQDSNKVNSYTIRGSGTKVENIELAVNDYYADNNLYSHAVPVSMLATSNKPKKNMVIESPDLDVTNLNGWPIGFFPQPVKITRIQAVAYQATGTGACSIDIGVEASIGSIVSGAPFTEKLSVQTAPYGVQEITGYTAPQTAGTVRARIKDNTMASGKIRIRIFYETIE